MSTYTLWLPDPIGRKIVFFHKPVLTHQVRVPYCGAIQSGKGSDNLSTISRYIDPTTQQLTPDFFYQNALPSLGFDEVCQETSSWLTSDHEGCYAFQLQWFYWGQYVTECDLYWSGATMTIRPHHADEHFHNSIHSADYSHADNAFYCLYPIFTDIAQWIPHEEWVTVTWSKVMDLYCGRDTVFALLSIPDSTLIEVPLWH